MKRIFEIPWVLFEKSVNLYFDWPKSWIWRTLEQITNNFSKWHFYNASKEVFWPKKILNFMHGFESAILAIFTFCQRGLTGFQKFFSFRVPLNPKQAWKAKLEGALFLGDFKNLPGIKLKPNNCRKVYIFFLLQIFWGGNLWMPHTVRKSRYMNRAK